MKNKKLISMLSDCKIMEHNKIHCNYREFTRKQICDSCHLRDKDMRDLLKGRFKICVDLVLVFLVVL